MWEINLTLSPLITSAFSLCQSSNSICTDRLDGSAQQVNCVKSVCLSETLPQCCDRRSCVDLSFGDTLNPSVNKGGFR